MAKCLSGFFPEDIRQKAVLQRVHHGHVQNITPIPRWQHCAHRKALRMPQSQGQALRAWPDARNQS